MTKWIKTDSLSNQDISSALAIGAYTATADESVSVQLFIDQVAGGGDYVYYLTLQVAGAGSSYVFLKTTQTAAAGETAIGAQSIPIDVRTGDVLTVYVDGLAGDTTTPDTVVRWFGHEVLVTLADDAITAAKIAADAIGASELAADAIAEIAAAVLAVGTVFPAGAIEYTYTVSDVGTGLPIAGVEVWFTTDAGGNNVVWSGTTDAFGVARDVNGGKPRLDTGTYYVWKQRAGYVDDQNPDLENVS